MTRNVSNAVLLFSYINRIIEHRIFRMIDYIEKVKNIIIDLNNTDGRVRKVYSLTFGCQQNEADSERLLGTAISMGYVKCAAPEEADLILVNTCAIREHAELKALSIIGQFKHLKDKNRGLIIGVCGCMTAQEHRVNELKHRYPYVSFTLDPSEMSMLPYVMYRHLTEQKRIFLLDESVDNIGEGMPAERSNPLKSWLSIMYGCNNFCTYCIVPYVRDRERSRSKDAVMSEARALVASGTREITLLGQNVNSYKGECNFAELLDEVASIDGDYIVRFMTSHPKDASDELFDVMANNPKIARHFHLPLQSGSDDVLMRMNRRYGREKYMSLIDKLREKMPDITITSDIIVGFPGETEADFEDTLDIIRRARFDMIYSFIYSPRKGTPAAEMPDQIPREVQNARFDRLLELQNSIALEKNEEMVGRVFRCLSEGESKSNDGIFVARTEGNKIVHFVDPDGSTKGKFVDIRINRAEPFLVHGELVK